MTDALDALSPKQQQFVREYMVDFNGTRAAIAAGYSEKSAAVSASTLIRNPKIAAALAQMTRERNERLQTDSEWLLSRLRQEADADVNDIIDPVTRAVKPINEWPAIWRRGLVSGIDVEQLWEGTGEDRKVVGQLVKVRLSDRAKRLEMIGKHTDVGAFLKKIAVDADDGLKEFLNGIAGGVRPKE